MTAGSTPARLIPIEIAAGQVLEPLTAGRTPRPPGAGSTPRAALEVVLLRALAAGPCGVSFSGGRDSSLVLAIAAHVARREGLPDPVAVTMRHRSVESQEDEFQKLVLDHLAITDHRVVELGDSMDAVGPTSTQLLSNHGVRFPPNAYLHDPLCHALGPGTLLTGVGGDELLGTSGGHLAQVLAGRTRPRPRDVLSTMLALSPRPMRAHREQRAFERPSWLTRTAADRVVRHQAWDSSRVRLRWDIAAMRYSASRTVAVFDETLRLVGRPHGVKPVNPLLDSEFVAAQSRAAGFAGHRSRTDAMRLLGGDLLPEPVLTRPTKASFGSAVWGDPFRDLVTAWNPRWSMPALQEAVDPDGLRMEWNRPRPHFGTMMLAQQAWLDLTAGSR